MFEDKARGISCCWNNLGVDGVKLSLKLLNVDVFGDEVRLIVS